MKAHQHKTTQKRLKILDNDEIEAIYGRPSLTQQERIEYFSLAPPEKAVLEQFHSLKSKVFFILQLGYFKVRHLFFIFGLQEVAEDATYIKQEYFSYLSIG